METIITPESTLLRRLTHGKMSRALCLEAGDRIEELEYGLTEAVKAIQSLDIDALGIVQEAHNCPAYPIRDALLHDLCPLISKATGAAR